MERSGRSLIRSDISLFDWRDLEKPLRTSVTTSISESRFKPDTSRTRNTSAKHLPTTFGLLVLMEILSCYVSHFHKKTACSNIPTGFICKFHTDTEAGRKLKRPLIMQFYQLKRTVLQYGLMQSAC